MNFAHCLHIVLDIGKYTYILQGDFSGRGGGFTREDPSMKVFSWGSFP